MGKYTPEELQFMAIEVLDDESRGGGRAVVLYMRVAQIANLHPMEVRQRIVAFAGGSGE
jgi:hypothetical protein